jgi:sortase A
MLDRVAEGKERCSVRWIERGLLVLSAVCLSIWTWNVSAARVYQAAAGRRFDELVGRSASWPRGWQAGPTGRAYWRVGDSEPIGRIEIPRIGLSAIIAEGVDTGTLQLAVGHVPATALPGQPGNVVLAGHRDSFFRGLNHLRAGDRVRLTTMHGVFDYQVDSTQVVGPGETDVLLPSTDRSLTLITCYPFHYVGPAPMRFIVHAQSVSRVKSEPIVPL